jgi:hypothetical protein
MQINITANTDAVRAAIGQYGNQARFAAAVALTRTGQDVKKAQGDEIRRVFSNPTPFTQRAVFLSKATKNKLQAVVWLKDGYSDKPHYLSPQILGGERPLKRFEYRLVKTGYMRATERLVPTKYAPTNSYGNIGRGAVTRILSQLKTAVVSGDFSNASDSRVSRKKRAGEQFFWSGGPGTVRTYVRKAAGANQSRLVSVKEHLPRGVWMVKRTAFGNAVVPIFSATTARYTKRYDFYGVAQRVMDANFTDHFNTALANALATAR